MRKLLILPIFLLIAFGCAPRPDTSTSEPAPATTADQASAPIWRAELNLGPRALPFNFTFDPEVADPEMVVHNAAERLKIDDIRREGDSIHFRMPFFDSEIHAILAGDSLSGIWHNRARTNKNRLSFTAQQNDERRFIHPEVTPQADLSGKWEVTFVHQEIDTSQAIGQFAQSGNALSGTFRTPTGDYRYLEGRVDGDQLYLSCFDGAHAFLFEAQLQEDGQLAGGFWSGAHWYESWSAKRNPEFTIAHPDSLTFLREGYTTVEFAFPNVDSQIVSLQDERYRGKVVLVEVMGTWCPNCMDETALLDELYAELHAEGLEVISLAFEMKDEFAYAQGNVQRMIATYDLPYEVLIAGRAGRKTAGAALPQLNHVMSYPTTLFVDRKGEVRRIHTGFSGPATGEVYERLVIDFRKFVRELLDEQPA
ncbi:MAG: TlpA disulfide reductase family protein [Bacteroidota bacterium]